MRFYVSAGSIDSLRAGLLADVLTRRGHEHALDRTFRRGDERDEATLAELAFSELRAVRDAELVLILLPGGADTHTELGVAIATRGNTRIILWSERGEEFRLSALPSAYYLHSCVERVVCPFDELVNMLDKEQIG